MKRFFIRVLCGAPLVFLVTAIVMGDIGSAAQLLALSIICTAGIGLVFWVPLWWITGTVLLWGIGWARGTTAAETMTPHEPRPRTDRDVIANFIRRYRDKGGAIDDAVARLRREGWEDSEIDAALLQVS